MRIYESLQLSSWLGVAIGPRQHELLSKLGLYQDLQQLIAMHFNQPTWKIHKCKSQTAQAHSLQVDSACGNRLKPAVYQDMG